MRQSRKSLLQQLHMPSFAATIVLFSTIILAGCMTVQAQTETPVETQPDSQMETQPQTPADTQPSNVNAGKICLLEGDLPTNTPFVVLGSIDKSKMTYGSKDSLYPAMAEEAKEMGANAVIQVDDFLAPSWFGWATPHLKGKAIKLDDLTILNSVNCQWF